jgi:RNA polymerase sigma-70 factor, ECF subfamily
VEPFSPADRIPIVGACETLSDQALVDQLLQGRAAAFNAAATALYRRHSAAVYRFASMMAPSKEIASDATQETFVWLATMGERGGAQRFDASRGSLAALLCGVARNHVLRLQSSDARFVLSEDDAEFNAIVESHHANDAQGNDTPDALDAVDAADRQRALMSAVTALPFEFREVIILIEFEEFSYEEAAATIGCPIGTVRSRLNRAKARLKASLTELFAAETGNNT